MSEAITAYPLCWPAGWKRTQPQSRKRAQFNRKDLTPSSVPGSYFRRTKALSVSDASSRVIDELMKLGVIDRGDIVVSTDLKTRLDGLPYSNLKEPNDPGAAVYWRLPHESKSKCMAIDRYDRVADNLAAIAATIAAMRAIERHGGAEILDRVFLGFQALPPPMSAGRPWQEVLHLSGYPGDPTLEKAEQVYRELAKKCHPDNGGNLQAMQELNDAIRQAREYFQ